jgi:SAM-dependent methyltransferase
MPNPYPLLYRIGFTPWEGATDDGPISDLLVQLPAGRALDAGCGTGRLAVSLATHGWHVTGVDSVAKPLARAGRRAEAAGVTHRTRFLKADVTALDEALPGDHFDLVTDVGCLHGLMAGQQQAFAAWVTAHTNPGAKLVVLAAMPRTGLGPKGLNEAGVSSLFGPPWALEQAADSPMTGAGPLKGAKFRWYVLGR